MAATSASLRPTRLVFDETDAQVLSEHRLLITLTPTVSSLDRSEFIGLSAAVLEKLYEGYEDILEGVLKLPQIHDHDQFVVLFHKDEGSLSRRISLGQGTIDLDFEDKKGNYLRICKTLAQLKVEQIDLYKSSHAKYRELCVKGEPTDPSMQWSPNMKFIRTSTPGPKPTPLNPNPNPSPFPSIDCLIQEIGKQSSLSRHYLLHCNWKQTREGSYPQIPQVIQIVQLPTSGCCGSTPQDKPPNGNAPYNNPPNLPESNDSILDPDKLGETIAKANENLVQILASHGLLRTQTPKISQFSGDELKGDVSFEHWEYEIETLRKAYTQNAIKEAITKSLKGSTAESLRSLGPLATVEQILQSMKGKYGIAASYDSLMRDFYALVQEESEKVPQFATKIEIKLASIKWRFPNSFLSIAEFTVLRDMLFFGLKKIRDSIRFRFSDPTISCSELLRLAREAEVEKGGSDSGSKRKSFITHRTKSKVYSAVVLVSN